MTRKEVKALRAKDREEAAALVQAAAGPRVDGETIKARILRTAKQLGWEISRTQEIWRKDARRIEAHEMDQLRALAGATIKPSEFSESGGEQPKG